MQHGLLRVEIVALAEVPEPQVAVVGDPPAVRLLPPGEEPQQRRLAVAVAPDHADAFTPADAEADRVEECPSPEAFGNGFQIDQVRWNRHIAPQGSRRRTRARIVHVLTPSWLDGLALGEADSADPLEGGYASKTYRVRTSLGRSVIVKTQTDLPPDLYALEADGLDALRVARRVRRTGSASGHAGLHRPRRPRLRRPGRPSRPLGRRRPRAGPSSTSRPPTSSATTRTTTWASSPSETRGRTTATPSSPNTACSAISKSPTATTPYRPTTAAASNASPTASPTSSRSQPPSLLHGDLWHGNLLPTPEGHPALIDPAVYYGWPEAELSMLHGCGNIPDAFYAAYEEAPPPGPGLARPAPPPPPPRTPLRPGPLRRLPEPLDQDPRHPRALA